MSGAAQAPWPPARAAWTATGLLTLAYIVSFIDRGVLSLLVQPIKASLHLSDTEIGLVQGTAFGVFFTLMAIPFGWLADSRNRMRIVAGGVALWSVMTAACGLSTSFVQLFLARMGVGVGEATLSPCAPSLLGDFFPPERRTLPLSLYAMATGVGYGFSLIAGATVAGSVGSAAIAVPGLGALEPWQVVFIAVGLPGLIVSAVFFVSREPARRDGGAGAASTADLCALFRERRAILAPQLAGYAVFQIYAYGLLAWLPAYFIRVHGWSLTETGFRFGLVEVTCSLPGGAFAGWLARALWTRGHADANLKTAALTALALAIPGAVCVLLPDGMASLIATVPLVILANGPAGASVSAIQEVVPNRLRGRVTAIYYALLSLIGTSSGGLVIGLMNDHLFHDPKAVGKSLALAAVVLLPIASALLFVAGRARRRLTDIG